MYSKDLHKSRGFTLLELMVSITILGILAVAGIASFTGTFGRARDSKATTDIDAIQKALELYYTINDEYPGDLPTLVTVDGVNVTDEGQYIKGGVVPVDKATGGEYIYHLESNGDYCLCSLGFEHKSVSGANSYFVSTIPITSVTDCSDITQMEKDHVVDTDNNQYHYCVYNAQ